MNAYWGHQRRSSSRGQMPPPYGHAGPPPGYRQPPGPPRGGGDRSAKLMVVLTLVGTIATVLGVLLTIGVGPFDLSGDDKEPSPVVPAANGAQVSGAPGGKLTLEAWVAKVNEVCGKETTEFTDRLQAKDAALDAGDGQAYAKEMAQLSRRMDGIVTQLKAVPLPENGDKAKQWRDKYIKRSELLSESAGYALIVVDPGTDEATAQEAADLSDAKLTELDALDADEIKPLAEKLGVSCP